MDKTIYTFSKEELTELIKFYNKFFQRAKGSLHQSEILFISGANKWFELVYSPNSNYLSYCFVDKEDCEDGGYFFRELYSTSIPSEQLELIYNVVTRHRKLLIERNKRKSDIIKNVGAHDAWLLKNYEGYTVYPS